MKGIFTNSSSRGDFTLNAFMGRQPTQVFIAVAFFTYPDPIIELAEAGYRVRLLVRLGHPTKPSALRKIIDQEGIQIKFVNDSAFHPKLYIFAEQFAIVGSSNLTESAMKTNQEVNIVVDQEDSRFSELTVIFAEYWEQAKVLSRSDLEVYESICSKHSKLAGPEYAIERDLDEKLGRNRIANITGRLQKKSSSRLYMDSYHATYQQFLDSYRTVERVYISQGRRKYDENILPIRIEIDNFLSWVRESKTTGESYLNEPLRAGHVLENKILETIDDWFNSTWKWLDEKVVPYSYPTISRILGSAQAIEASSFNEIVQALSCEHSFFDRLRFFPGGHDTHVSEFKSKNEEGRVKKTIKYLLFGKDEFVDRMGNCIYDPEYKLEQFSTSAVQELLGWVNKENIPICNSRTLRALRYFGFNIYVRG